MVPISLPPSSAGQMECQTLGLLILILQLLGLSRGLKKRWTAGDLTCACPASPGCGSRCLRVTIFSRSTFCGQGISPEDAPFVVEGW